MSNLTKRIIIYGVGIVLGFAAGVFTQDGTIAAIVGFCTAFALGQLFALEGVDEDEEESSNK